VMIMNHQPYPLTIAVATGDGQLELSHRSIVVQDIGVLKIWLKQSWWERHISKKHYKQPVITQELTLSIQHEHGIDQELIPIHFTTYSVAPTHKAISSDQSYKRTLIQAQSDYNRYIIKKDKEALREACQSLEAAIAYEGTDSGVWMFYLLLLIEADRLEDVKSHSRNLMKFSGYYLDDHKEEFVEILNILEAWIKGSRIQAQVDAWPMTGYRQLYRLRVLTEEQQDFSDYESLYNNGYKSTHLFAHVAREMAVNPYVPTKASPFYKSLLMWAINKGVMSPTWLAYLEKMQFQVTNAGLINCRTARHLYGMDPCEQTLRMLVAITLSENRHRSVDNAIYLEALKTGVFFRDLEQRYIESSYFNRLPIVFEYIHLYGLLKVLDKKVTTYLLRCYIENELLDKGPHVLAMRRYREVLLKIQQDAFDDDQAGLMVYDLALKIRQHQWASIARDYPAINLNLLGEFNQTFTEEMINQGASALGYDWLHQRMLTTSLCACFKGEERHGYIDWLIEQGLYKEVTVLYEEGHLSQCKLDKRIKWTNHLIDVGWPHGRVMGDWLFGQGIRDKDFLTTYQKVFIAPVAEMIPFYEVLKEKDVCRESYMTRLLYKGVLTRQRPEQILKVYCDYRKQFDSELVITYMDHFFSAVILIEDAYGYEALKAIFEKDITSFATKDNKSQPIALALLRLYQLYGHDNDVMCDNLVKNAVKNGIIFPWFASLAQPYIQKGAMRKGVFFAYHCKPWISVKMHYRCDDQEAYVTLPMKHVFFGFYIGYVMAFYKDHIQYYYEEEDAQHKRQITESGLHIHDVFTEPIGNANEFDVVNTMIMSEVLKDEESLVTVIKEHIDHRTFISNEMTRL